MNISNNLDICFSNNYCRTMSLFSPFVVCVSIYIARYLKAFRQNYSSVKELEQIPDINFVVRIILFCSVFLFFYFFCIFYLSSYQCAEKQSTMNHGHWESHSSICEAWVHSNCLLVEPKYLYVSTCDSCSHNNK